MFCKRVQFHLGLENGLFQKFLAKKLCAGLFLEKMTSGYEENLILFKDLPENLEYFNCLWLYNWGNIPLRSCMVRMNMLHV